MQTLADRLHNASGFAFTRGYGNDRILEEAAEALEMVQKWTNRLDAVHGGWVRGEVDDAPLDAAVRDLLMHTKDALT